MIHAAVTHITNQLNQFLKRNYELNEDIVILTNLVEQDGTLSPDISNKLVVFLVNIEKDTLPHQLHKKTVQFAEREGKTYQPVYLNLYLLFTGHFSGKNYSESLKFISETIHFFQINPLFDHNNSPELDSRIDRLVLDIENLDITKLSNLWGVISSKYLPSILYKVRMVAFDSGDIRTMTPVLQDVQANVKAG